MSKNIFKFLILFKKSQVFNALRLEYDDVLENGEMKTLNNATLNQFLKSKDDNVRKQAYTNFFKEYKKFENVFAQTARSSSCSFGRIWSLNNINELIL